MTTKASFNIVDPLPQGTVLLAASAGTGKTWTISAVCAKAIATGMVNIENLLLVTFNRSAARELRGRVYERLVSTASLLAGRRKSADACDDSVMSLGAEGLKRVEAALDSFDRAVITTTHEFASRMLAELGVLSDHDPRCLTTFIWLDISMLTDLLLSLTSGICPGTLPSGMARCRSRQMWKPCRPMLAGPCPCVTRYESARESEQYIPLTTSSEILSEHCEIRYVARWHVRRWHGASPWS